MIRNVGSWEQNPATIPTPFLCPFFFFANKMDKKGVGGGMAGFVPMTKNTHLSRQKVGPQSAHRVIHEKKNE